MSDRSIHCGCISRLIATTVALLLVGTHTAAGNSPEGMLGVLTPVLEVELEPSIEGQLVSVEVRIGDSVGEGSLIAALDGQPIRRDLNEAEAKLEAVRAMEEEATTRLRMAQDGLERQRALIESQAVSREAVRGAEQQVDLAMAELNRARAEVRHHEASVEYHRTRLRQTRITAPFSGTVAERYGNPGMTVGPGRAVARLISNDMLWARFAAPVEQARELALDREIRVVVTDLGVELRGRIRQIGSEVDPASGMIICEAMVEWPDGWTGPPLSGQAVRIWMSAESIGQ